VSAPGPLLHRIRVVTTTTPDLDESVSLYADWLGMKVRASGPVEPSTARSWGAETAAGRRFALVSSDGAPDVMIRFVEGPPHPGYRPMTTFGWNSWEIIVDDPYRLHDERLVASPFRVIGAPHPLDAIPSIHATQVVGSAGEVLYLTAEMGDRSDSLLPLPGAFVGRPFIVVVSGPDVTALRDWYASTFRLEHRPVKDRKVDLLVEALGLPDGALLPLTTCKLGQHGNLIEFDGYPARAANLRGHRTSPRGELPPGNAMASFGVSSLDEFDLDWLAPPTALPGPEYGGRRAATARGPAGELIELIEE